MSESRPQIAIVDDDESIRESLPHLIRELGYAAQVYVSAEAFLASDHLPQTDCLILDLAMPGMSGWALQATLAQRGIDLPVIFITAHDDEKVRLRAQQAGASGYLSKPFSDLTLLLALDRALGK
jgi:FixJ family two-component response regulator